MKTICKKSNLIKALNIASRAVSPVSALGITKGVLIKTEGDTGLSLSATDLHMSITTNMGAIVNERGSIVVEARVFSELVRKLPEEDIVLSTDEKNRLLIKTETTDNEFQGIDEGEFPRVEGVDGEERFAIDRETLKGMIEGTCFAASTDESRGVIIGTLLELDEGEFSLVALDGYRVALRREYREALKEEKRKAIIPAKMLREAGKILSESEDEEISVGLGKNRAVLYLEDTTIRMNLLNGEYIRYKDAIPQSGAVKATVRKDELLSAVELAEIYKSDGKNSFLRFAIGGSEIVISSRAEIGRGKETVNADIEGGDLEIGFDARFMKEALRAIDEEEVVLSFNTSISPCVITAREGSRFMYMILPVKLSSVNA